MKKKPINRFKLTPDVYKNIKELSASLPKVAKTDNKGNIIYQDNTSKTILGKDLTPQQRQQLKGNILDTDRFIMKEKNPLIVNHEVKLVELYQQHGQLGINTYVHNIKELVEEAAKKKKELQDLENASKNENSDNAPVIDNVTIDESSNETEEQK